MSDDPVTQYALDVTEGRIVAGPYVRHACRRHLRDLDRGVWTFDRDKAMRAIGFFKDVLRLNGGQFEGKLFIPEPWQQFIIGSLFGWIGPDGYRRFRMAYIEGGKGCGKSPLVAGIGLYMMVADNEPRAEVYAAARHKEQAFVLYRDAVAMIKQSPALRSRIKFSGGEGREWNIAYLKTSSFFRPVSMDDGASGPRPHCGLIDEIHEHRDNGIVEMLRAGTKGRTQAMIVMITNSGHDRTSVCFHYHVYAGKVCAGDFEDDSFFGYVCALDDGDDPFNDESCWIKANPSLGVTIPHKYLREQVNQAKGMPAKEGLVKRLNFCVWTEAAEHWIDRDLWEACEEEFDEEDLAGEPCCLGLDLSSKRDLTALAAVWRRHDGHLFLKTWAWTPRETMDQRGHEDNVPYRMWVEQGHLFATGGRLIDRREVAMWMQEWLPNQNVVGAAYDTAMMDDFLRTCDDIGLESWIDDGKSEVGDGLRFVRHGQGFAGYQSQKILWMPRSIEMFEEVVSKRKITIHPSPVLRWCSANAVLESDASNNRKWSKRKATGRIDCVVASSMAVGLALRDTEDADSMPEDYEVKVW